MKTLLVIVIAITLSSCDGRNIFGDFPGTEIPATVQIIRSEESKRERIWGCNSNYVAWVKSESGFVDKYCGYLGEVGESVSGFWVNDAAGIYRNGFRSN